MEAYGDEKTRFEVEEGVMTLASLPMVTSHWKRGMLKTDWTGYVRDARCKEYQIRLPRQAWSRAERESKEVWAQVEVVVLESAQASLDGGQERNRSVRQSGRRITELMRVVEYLSTGR
jgi:hypothetical protein